MTNNENHYAIQVKKIDDLTPRQLYRILELRFNTFVLEQKSIFPEFDDYDFIAEHIFMEIDEHIATYARAFKVNDETATFGRVVVDKSYRGKHLGRKIVEKTIDVLKAIPTIKTIEIEAQEYLQDFYESFGFVRTSEPFDDAGVIHISMELKI